MSLGWPIFKVFREKMGHKEWFDFAHHTERARKRVEVAHKAQKGRRRNKYIHTKPQRHEEIAGATMRLEKTGKKKSIYISMLKNPLRLRVSV